MQKIIRTCLLLLCFISMTSLGATYNTMAAHTNAKLGLAYLQKGMYSASKDALLTAIKEDPRLASVWYSMAYYLEKTNHLKAAEAYYRKAIEVNPHSGSAKNNYGTYLCRVGRQQEGIQAFIDAAREPSYLNAASAYENAGTCALMMHNKTLAMQYFHKSLDNNPDMPFALLSLARLNHQMGNEPAAEKYFTYFKKLSLAGKPANIVRQYQTYVFGATSS